VTLSQSEGEAKTYRSSQGEGTLLLPRVLEDAHQVIVAQKVVPEGADAPRLIPMVDAITGNLPGIYTRRVPYAEPADPAPRGRSPMRLEPGAPDVTRPQEADSRESLVPKVVDR
jgi:hypothetical protein